MADLVGELQRLELSAQDIRQMVDWPDPLIEDYLSIIRNLVTLAEQLVSVSASAEEGASAVERTASLMRQLNKFINDTQQERAESPHLQSVVNAAKAREANVEELLAGVQTDVAWLRASLNAIKESSYHIDTNAVGNVGTGEDDLITYLLPANRLYLVGQGVRITAWGSTAAVSGAKAIKAYFGSQEMGSIEFTTSDARQWRLNATVWVTGENAQDWEMAFQPWDGGTFSDEVNNGTSSETTTSDITIKCTGEATNDDDIVQEGLLAELVR